MSLALAIDVIKHHKPYRTVLQQLSIATNGYIRVNVVDGITPRIQKHYKQHLKKRFDRNMLLEIYDQGIKKGEKLKIEL